MGEMPPPPDGRDPVDGALDDLQRWHAAGRAPSTLEDHIVQGVRRTAQARRSRVALAWGRAAGLTRARASVGLAWIAIAAVAVAVLGVGILVWGPHPATGPAATPPAAGGASSPSAPARPTATAGQATPSEAGAGTCPVTSITRVVGGTAPEVDASGLRWRWGGVPWAAGNPEKVVWLADAGRPPVSDVVLFGLRLDRSIDLTGASATYPGTSDHAIFATGAGNVQDVVLPGPGCWLLTAVWSGGASSVVVAVSPATATSDGSGSAAPSPVPSPSTVTAVPLATCPASTRLSGPGSKGSDNPDYLDGAFRWLTPEVATWLIGGDGDKLVLYSGAGWDIGHMAIEAVPVVEPSAIGWLGRSAVEGDIPPGFGGGTLGFGLTLPSRGCWAIAYAGSQGTSTIVVDLGR